ncbi:hypothetical protein [Luteococcus peritonei]|uniref:DUF4367 domain-containing protein n=1 Tax=Luteococcus peritonei TaxID=88874 RepID=A0ABW4RY17_9ACTN
MDEQWSFTRPSATMASDEWVSPSMLVAERPVSSLFDPGPDRHAGAPRAADRTTGGTTTPARPSITPRETGHQSPPRVARQSTSDGPGLDHPASGPVDEPPAPAAPPEVPPRQAPAPRALGEPVGQDRDPGTPVRSASFHAGQRAATSGQQPELLQLAERLFGKDVTALWTARNNPGTHPQRAVPQQSVPRARPPAPGVGVTSTPTSRRGFLALVGIAAGVPVAVTLLGDFTREPEARVDSAGQQVESDQGNFLLPTGWSLSGVEGDWVVLQGPAEDDTLRLTRSRRDEPTTEAVALAVLEEQTAQVGILRSSPGLRGDRQIAAAQSGDDSLDRLAWVVPDGQEYVLLLGGTRVGNLPSLVDPMTTVISSLTTP